MQVVIINGIEYAPVKTQEISNDKLVRDYEKELIQTVFKNQKR
ncbi:hypothetical protein [Seonamhaeicola sp.]